MSDFLSDREAIFCEQAIRELTGQKWAASLLGTLDAKGGLTGKNKALLFELRFAYALHRQGLAPTYEIPGEGESKIDFGFSVAGASFRVELMRLTETDAAKAATQTVIDKDGIPWSEKILESSAGDPRQSEEGETLKAVERICQKFERGGQPHKFPLPSGSTQILLIDFRTFLDGGDVHDKVHIALGGEHVNTDWVRRFWKGKLISGVFSDRTSLRGAAEARQRVHFLGFVCEKEYDADEFAHAIQFIANPHMYGSRSEKEAALGPWPLKPSNLVC